jgi:hypothetical protein
MSQPQAEPARLRSLLRTVPKDKYTLSSPIDVALTAFTPGNYDDDGLSVNFDDEITAEELVARSRKPESTIVVRIPESLFKSLGLTLVPTHDPGDSPGHAIIPELNRGRYDSSAAEKQAIKVIAAKLAQAASQGIVHVPPEVQRKVLSQQPPS